MVMIYVWSEFHVRNTPTRLVTRSDEARKKVAQKHLEITFLCISDYLGKIYFFPFRHFFSKIFLSPRYKIGG